MKDDIKVDSDDDDIDNEIYLPISSSSTKDLSPTQSVRSLLLRPRSTPIRRATISAGSPTKHQPYMNVSDIWVGMFDTSKSNKSNNSDGGSKQSSTASSTMQSTDSGCATMYSPSIMFNAQDKYPRPITIGPEYINMTSPSNNPHEDYINLFACSTLNKPQNPEISEKPGLPKREPPPPPPPPRMPKAKPRLNVSLSRESSIDESNSNSIKKKRPVPQPRKLSNPRQLPPKSLSTSKVLVSSDVQPVSLPATKIYKKVVSTSSIPDPVPLPSLPPQYSSSSSSSEENDDPPALPSRQRIN